MENKLILASNSPRRKELLSSIGLELEIVPADVDETFIVGNTAAEEASRLSLAKADKIASEFPGRFVLAADTIVAIGDKLLAKPEDEAESVAMLESLQGRTHSVVTGCAIVSSSPKSQNVFHVETKVTFKSSSKEELLSYSRSGDPFDKAGGYGIQGVGAFLIASIDGSYTNVVGLPLAEVTDVLLTLGVWSPGLLSNSPLSS
ncbi:UNVERIFIED_CONTAM: hypothetical protein GTU68_063280 [Idotea baltica]|nr:hypothetical protein [Idotea baltica]